MMNELMKQNERPSEVSLADSYREAVSKGIPYRDKDGVLHYPTLRSRPEPNFTVDPLHRLLLLGSSITGIGYFIWVILRIPMLPDRLPMNFNDEGEVTRYGSSWEMLIPLASILVCLLGCAVLARYPRIFNYGFGQITEHNIQEHYKNGVRLMAWLTLGLTIVLITMGGAMMGDWSASPGLWISLVATLAPVAVFVVKMTKT